jgi:hypothetical protein
MAGEYPFEVDEFELFEPESDAIGAFVSVVLLFAGSVVIIVSMVKEAVT